MHRISCSNMTWTLLRTGILKWCGCAYGWHCETGKWFKPLLCISCMIISYGTVNVMHELCGNKYINCLN
jgi:hypothetical protein